MHVWMDSYGAGPSDNNKFKVEISPVLNTFSWTKFLDVALPVFNINFYQSVMMMAGAIACSHYPYSILIAGKLCMLKLSHRKNPSRPHTVHAGVFQLSANKISMHSRRMFQ